MYLTYQEYESYGGTLDETTFNNFEFEAEGLINWYTFNRLVNDVTFPESVKRLMFYLIKEADHMNALVDGSVDGTGSAITSQSNDGVSISYNVLSATEIMNTLKTQQGEVIKRYLQGVKNEAGRLVLYRGVYPNE